MRLPTQLSRNKKNVHKNSFGHVLILSGSRRMLGAAALSSLSALRTGCGLVTVGTPKSLNKTLQKKLSPEIMTLPLPETKDETISSSAFKDIESLFSQYQAIAIGPGLSLNKSTIQFVYRIIAKSPVPLVIDADALNAVALKKEILIKTKTPKIITPHPGEMSRLANTPKKKIEEKRREAAQKFSQKYGCVTLLKGNQTIVASAEKIYINRTGNAGMATAGSGDVLTGMISALLAQKFDSFDAAKWGAYLHGKAGDLAIKKLGKTSLIASDIIHFIPKAFQSH